MNKCEWMSSWSQNKYKINRIRNPSTQLQWTKRSEEKKVEEKKKKKPTHYNISSTRFPLASSMWWCLLIWCNLWSKFFSFLFISNYSLGQWNNEKAVCSYTEILFILADPNSVYFVVDVMWPNNKSKWVFIHFKCFKTKVKSSWNVRRKYSWND